LKFYSPNGSTKHHYNISRNCKGAYRKSSKNNKAKYIKRRAKFQTFLEIVSCKCKYEKNKFHHFHIHRHI